MAYDGRVLNTWLPCRSNEGETAIAAYRFTKADYNVDLPGESLWRCTAEVKQPLHSPTADIYPPSQSINSGGIINANHGGSTNALLSRNESLAKPPLVAALGTRATQVWVKALVWHSVRVSSRMQAMILSDTGANYASSAFLTLVEETSHSGRSIKKSTGKGCLRSANHHSVNVPPMSVIGSCTIPLVFSPMNRVYEATVRVVQDLPYSVVLSTAFMKGN